MITDSSGLLSTQLGVVIAMSQVKTARSRGRPANAFRDTNEGQVVALDRGIQVLEHLAEHGGGKLSDLARETGIPIATVHRILNTLRLRGMVEFSDQMQQWFVGIESFRIGNAYIHRTNIVEAARPVMHELTQQTGETSNLAVTNEGDVVFLSQVETDNPIRAFFRPGARGYMHSSGIGKALLANMETSQVEAVLAAKGMPRFTLKTVTDRDAFFEQLTTIRERGWSYDDEERYLGMRCVAAPIFNSFGEAIAGISVSGLTVRLEDERIDELGTVVKEAAMAITKAFGSGDLP